MSNDSVFSRCIHALEYQQECPGVFRIKPVGEFINGRDIFLADCQGFFLRRATGCTRVKILETDFAVWLKGGFL
jgi:hypothetical protein